MVPLCPRRRFQESQTQLIGLGGKRQALLPVGPIYLYLFVCLFEIWCLTEPAIKLQRSSISGP